MWGLCLPPAAQLTGLVCVDITDNLLCILFCRRGGCVEDSCTLTAPSLPSPPTISRVMVSCNVRGNSMTK